MSQVESTQRIRYQIDMLNADLQQNPLRRTLNKPTADHQQESEPHNDNRTSNDETATNQKEDLDIVLTRESLTTIRVSKEEIRASSDTLIGQMAERFSARKRLSRPMVPRLSKSYVNEQTIFDSRFRYTSDAYPNPSKNRQALYIHRYIHMLFYTVEIVVVIVIVILIPSQYSTFSVGLTKSLRKAVIPEIQIILRMKSLLQKTSPWNKTLR